jgi:Fe-S oxidoreductase
MKPPGPLATMLSTPIRAVHTLGKVLGRFDYSHEVNRAMAGCLACKACATQCPVKVDVPAFRSHFLQGYHTRYLRPLRDHLVAGLESALAVMAFAPWFFNFFLRSTVFQRILAGLSGLVDTPLLASPSLGTHLRERGLPIAVPAALEGPTSSKKRVVIVQDAFTSFYEPRIVLAVRDLLERVGCDVHVAPYLPSGKGLHVKGFLRRFEKRARATAATLREFAASGATLVAIEPAVALAFRDEYRHTLGTDLDFEIVLLQELLAAIVHAEPPGLVKSEAGHRYRLFGHCTEKTLAPASQRQWAQIFEHFGLELELVSTGCCGMSGAFGHERIHREESKGIWDLSWGRWLGDEPSRILATGYSCRSQAHRFGGLSPLHPAEVLLAHFDRP